MSASVSVFLLAVNSALANFSGGDNFNSNFTDPTKWGGDSVEGSAVFTVVNQRLEYATTSSDASIVERGWILNSGSYNQDWSLTLSYLNTAPVTAGAGVAVSLLVSSSADASDFVEMDAYRLDTGNGYSSALFSDTVDPNPTTLFTGPVSGAQSGSLRIDFDSLNKVMTMFYDVDASNGIDWIRHSSFGIGGNNGTTANVDWQMTSSDSFGAALRVNSFSVDVPSGTVFIDNFATVPEPRPISLIAAGLFALAGFHYFRRSKKLRFD